MILIIVSLLNFHSYFLKILGICLCVPQLFLLFAYILMYSSAILAEFLFIYLFIVKFSYSLISVSHGQGSAL
jgi:hypothetical protein